MGNFSRDPEQRLADAEAKHYIAHRVQQGVPLLDADLHLIDGLRRHEMESIGQWVLRDGVPVGSDAFRIGALAGGGVNTLVLRAKTVGVGPSSVAVNLALSSAAGALGFTAANASSARTGDSPAQLTSGSAAPFVLLAGSTLTVVADGGAPETATFQPAAFANIAAATAAEVAAVINAAIARASAAAGTGADFSITGGDGTIAGAGRILVEGRLVLIERGLRYTEQPLYQNAALAAQWGVPPVASLPTPALNESQTIFLDVWHREVGRSEDPVIVDARIGIETAVSLRREWAVRAVAMAQFAATLAARPPGHSYYALAELSRTANDPRVSAAMIVDLRDTDASVRREIAFRNAAGVVTVNTPRFRAMLLVTRDNARDLIVYLTTKFVLPGDPYTAGEIAGIDTLSAIAATADHALVSVHTQTLGTRAAGDVMQQLYDAERRFVTTWKAAVLPLVRNGSTVYQTSFGLAIQLIEQFLDGPAPGGNVAIKDALPSGNLEGAVTSQERIASELGDQSSKPFGALSVKYLGSVTPTILAGAPFDLRFQVEGTLTPDDDLVVTPFIDPQWAVTLKNQNGSTPFAMRVGPGVFNRQFLVGVTPPNVGGANTLVSVAVSAKHNPGGVNFLTAQKQLTVGAAPPPSEDQFALTIFSTDATASGSAFTVPVGQTAHFKFRFENRTNNPVTIDLLLGNSATWVITPLTLPFTNRQIPAQQHRDFDFEFTAPAAAGNTLTFPLSAAQTGNNATVFASMIVQLRSV